MIPVVLGPEDRHYVIDHHHLARARQKPHAPRGHRARGRSIFAPDRIGERRNLPRDKSCCATLGHYKLYIRLAAASARVHPTRFPCLSRRLARAKVAANVAFACCSARLIEAGVGWRSSCAPIDCGAIGPAFGLPADWRTACSNCAILLLHGPACATAAPRPRAAATSKVTETRLMARRRMSQHLHDVFDRALPRFPARRRPDVRQGSVTSA